MHDAFAQLRDWPIVPQVWGAKRDVDWLFNCWLFNYITNGKCRRYWNVVLRSCWHSNLVWIWFVQYTAEWTLVRKERQVFHTNYFRKHIMTSFLPAVRLSSQGYDWSRLYNDHIDYSLHAYPVASISHLNSSAVWRYCMRPLFIR